MPQMFPMNWPLMFTIFIIMYLLITLLLNYNYNNTPLMKKLSLPEVMLNWKW
uniref:ATP synthase F0 subunit 8 n=1 Tax=Tropostreptus hamatus TaxID=2931681 RepID=A0A8T9JBP2_9MYRI|nr:ATP synthase F0 subunit 8 [Tropostreptus hamatus]UOF70182.1 ATP synthase F0 subunit 8 [Tropostreptus hamatus]